MEGKTLLGIMLTALYLLSLLYGGATGRAGAVGAAAMEGAQAGLRQALLPGCGPCSGGSFPGAPKKKSCLLP